LLAKVLIRYTTGLACGTGTTNPYGAHEFTPVFLRRFVLLDLQFSV
jgi:hypothetical protein